MYYVLSKDMIESAILPHLPTAKRGFKTQSSLTEIVNCILYKLKTGVQWHMLPVESLFSERVLHYKTVFGHYRKWCKQNAWKACWINLLSGNKSKLDLSSGDIDGSHTIALRGGEQTAYQGRKKRKTTNSLYLTDRQGLPLSMSEPVAGNHNDLYEIKTSTNELFDVLEEADIATEGLFINADAGFDAESFRQACQEKGVIANVAINKRNSQQLHEHILDEDLYNERYSVERTNAWMDSFRSVLNRFDTTTSSWKGFNFLAFIVIGLRKFNQSQKSR
jgi:transposase